MKHYRKKENIDKKVDISKVVNILYPIGSIYISADGTSPATLFDGIWEQIEDKTFIRRE